MLTLRYILKTMGMSRGKISSDGPITWSPSPRPKPSKPKDTEFIKDKEFKV